MGRRVLRPGAGFFGKRVKASVPCGTLADAAARAVEEGDGYEQTEREATALAGFVLGAELRLGTVYGAERGTRRGPGGAGWLGRD